MESLFRLFLLFSIFSMWCAPAYAGDVPAEWLRYGGEEVNEDTILKIEKEILLTCGTARYRECRRACEVYLKFVAEDVDTGKIEDMTAYKHCEGLKKNEVHSHRIGKPRRFNDGLGN